MAHLETASGEAGAVSADGLFDLGIVYAGSEATRDLIAAHKWFNLSSLRGHDEAAYHRQQIAEILSAADIVEAQRAAREWLSTH